MNTNSLEINRVVFDTPELEESGKTSVSLNPEADINIIFDKDDAKTDQSVSSLDSEERRHLDIVETEIAVSDLLDDQYDSFDVEWCNLDMKKAHNQYQVWRLKFLAGDSTCSDDQAEDQTYDSRKFGLEAACPPGSPAERLRSCGITITSYLLGAPSQIFTTPNCKIIEEGIGCTKSNEANNSSPIDHKRCPPFMGTKVLTVRNQQHDDESTQDSRVNVCTKLKTEFDIVCPQGSKVEKLVQWGWDIRKYLVNVESDTHPLYDVTKSKKKEDGTESEQKKEEDDIEDSEKKSVEDILMEINETKTEEHKTNGTKERNDTNQNRPSFRQRCADAFERIFKPRRKNKYRC